MLKVRRDRVIGYSVLGLSFLLHGPLRVYHSSFPYLRAGTTAFFGPASGGFSPTAARRAETHSLDLLDAFPRNGGQNIGERGKVLLPAVRPEPMRPQTLHAVQPCRTIFTRGHA